MAGAASLYRDRDKRLELQAQRESNNSDLTVDRKIHIQETMEWAAHGKLSSSNPESGKQPAPEDSYDNRRQSNLEKYKQNPNEDFLNFDNHRMSAAVTGSHESAKHSSSAVNQSL